MSRRALLVLAVLVAGCGGSTPPDAATSETQVRERMARYNQMQVTPGSGETLCSYLTPGTREGWKDQDNPLRGSLPPSVVDCASHWEYLIGLMSRSAPIAEQIRNDQITGVTVAGDTATATLAFGGTFEWRWEDGQWLLSGHA